MKLTSEQSKAARALLGWTSSELAERIGMAPPAIRRLERKPGEMPGWQSTHDAIRAALEAAGIEFIGPHENKVGVILRRDV